MKKKVLSFCLLIYLIGFELYAKPFNLDVFSKSAVLINADNGKVLFEKNANTLAFPASTTKIATVLYVIEEQPQMLSQYIKSQKDSLVILNHNDRKKNILKYPAYWLASNGTSIGIKSGEVLHMKSLLKCLMMRSANDAANVIAQGTHESINVFMSKLNAYLKKIGCYNTNFCNPHGLHHPNHMTTAMDLAIMTKRAKQFPFFNEIVNSDSTLRPRTKYHPGQRLFQFNKLLIKGDYHYPYANGVKTGHTNEAGHCLVTSARYNNRNLICVLLGGEKTHYRYIDAKRLFDRAFSEEKQNIKIIDKSTVYQRKIQGAASVLKASIDKDLFVDYFPSEEVQMKALLYWYDVKIPFKKNIEVGEIQVLDEDENIIKIEKVYSNNNVRRTFFSFVKSIFSKKK
jgi:serine-type D-Ala-D-Ala carboxypeptidase (penicillin-binding protein 5/6)